MTHSIYSPTHKHVHIHAYYPKGIDLKLDFSMPLRDRAPIKDKIALGLFNFLTDRGLSFEVSSTLSDE